MNGKKRDSDRTLQQIAHLICQIIGLHEYICVRLFVQNKIITRKRRSNYPKRMRGVKGSESQGELKFGLHSVAMPKTENKPFEPMRPRVALMRTDLQSRKKVEQRYKAIIKHAQRAGENGGMYPEREREAREEKEEWMLDLQEIYDKIHEELQKLIKYQQPNQRLVGEQAKKFSELLERQMQETEAMMLRLQNPEQKSVQSSREGILIAKQFRSSLKELHSLMQTVAITQVQKQFAQNFEFIRKLRQLRSRQLLNEIQTSTKRLEKVRLGNNLESVIQRQQLQYESARNSERMKKFNIFNKLRKKYPFDQDVQFVEPQFFKNGNNKSFELQQILNEFQIAETAINNKNLPSNQPNDDLNEQLNNDKLDKKPSSSALQLAKQFQQSAAVFENQRQKVEQIVDCINNIDGSRVDFDQKYKHINLYFQGYSSLFIKGIKHYNPYKQMTNQQMNIFATLKERKSLNNMYLGDTRLNNFLKNYDEKCQKIDKMRVKSQEEQNTQNGDSLNMVDLEFMDDNNIKSPHPIDMLGEGKNATTLNKVNRINQEIFQKLAEEEHDEKIQQIKRLGMEHSQNFWDQVKAKTYKLGDTKLPRPKNFLQKAQTSHGQRHVDKEHFLPKQEHIFYGQQKKSSAITKDTSSQFYLTEPPQTAPEKERQQWLNKQQRLILNAHPKNPILQIAFSQNKQFHYDKKHQFMTEPVNNMNFLVRKQHAKTTEISKRGSVGQRIMSPNQNQVSDDKFKETFYSNFYLFQDSKNTFSSSFKSFPTQDYTIRFPTASQQIRPKTQF